MDLQYTREFKNLIESYDLLGHNESFSEEYVVVNWCLGNTCNYACNEGSCLRCNTQNDCDDENELTYPNAPEQCLWSQQASHSRMPLADRQRRCRRQHP